MATFSGSESLRPASVRSLTIRLMLTAAAYGRTRWKKSENTGRMQGINLPRNQWRYCVQGKFPPYISWETFERIQTMLSDNYTEYARNKTRGVPRDGKALLDVRCSSRQ
ncbi:MAG: hypothetical protein CMJ64_09650 [Planctomycetaceae bacterium]|nr:hypothetical protein [Planctomycetaceae bacterium]